MPEYCFAAVFLSKLSSISLIRVDTNRPPVMVLLGWSSSVHYTLCQSQIQSISSIYGYLVLVSMLIMCLTMAYKMIFYIWDYHSVSIFNPQWQYDAENLSNIIVGVAVQKWKITFPHLLDSIRKTPNFVALRSFLGHISV